MNNILVIAYNGKKPTKRDIEVLAEIATQSFGFCDKVEIVKHYDESSILDTVGKGFTIIGFENPKNEALKNAATFINAHFKNAWDMIGQVAAARQSVARSTEQEALLNAVDIIASSKQEECEQYGIPSIMHNACYNVKYHILNID